MTSAGAASLPIRRPRNTVGIVAMVMVLFCAVAPLVTAVVIWVAGAADHPDDLDNAVSVGFLGGTVAFLATISLLSPMSFVAAILGVVSLWRPGSKAPGIVAIVLGAIGSIFLMSFPFVLSGIVPGL